MEETADDLYEDAPCGYVTTGPDGRILRVNRTFSRLTGHEAAAVVGRRRFADLLTVGGRIYHETHFAPLLTMQDEVSEIALDVRRADGGTLPVIVNAALRRDAAGAPALVRITLFDATDRLRFHREIQAARRAEAAARERAEHLQRITSALAATVEPERVAEVLAAASSCP